jgi:hypothetical protein
MEDVDGELGWFPLAFMLAEEGAREQVVWSFWRKGRLDIVRANGRLTEEKRSSATYLGKEERA